MGRTLATFTQLIAQETASWKTFRRALRREDQAVLDTLFEAAKYHMAAGSYASKARPFETMLMAMLIEASKKNALLEQRVLCLEEKKKDRDNEKKAQRVDL